jgi:pilus assembly protein TadC
MNNIKALILLKVNFLLLSLYFMLFSPESFGQAPTHLPQRDPDPVDLSPGRIIFFIGIPLVIIVLYLLWRRRVRKEKQ